MFLVVSKWVKHFILVVTIVYFQNVFPGIDFVPVDKPVDKKVGAKLKGFINSTLVKCALHMPSKLQKGNPISFSNADVSKRFSTMPSAGKELSAGKEPSAGKNSKQWKTLTPDIFKSSKDNKNWQFNPVDSCWVCDNCMQSVTGKQKGETICKDCKNGAEQTRKDLIEEGKKSRPASCIVLSVTSDAGSPSEPGCPRQTFNGFTRYWNYKDYRFPIIGW
ncbi:MAG: hypothetical protein OXE99_01175 [Cellvibrionales bacterium]|nr:hypothetical protein [Cellvibrionales bacterium]